MTEEEKAKEIIQSFVLASNPKERLTMPLNEAKQCALIHVEGIIDELKDGIKYWETDDNNIPVRKEFWQEVKSIIQTKY